MLVQACLAFAINYGPAGLLTLVALVLEQRRDAPNGSDPAGNIVYRVVAWGLLLVAASWLGALVAAMMYGTAFRSAHAPWMFALGELAGLLSLARSRAPREPIDM